MDKLMLLQTATLRAAGGHKALLRTTIHGMIVQEIGTEGRAIHPRLRLETLISAEDARMTE